MKKELLFCVQAILIGASLMSSCSKDDEESNPEQSPLVQLDASPVKAVDLGLSVKWANMNVGAKKVEDYGNRYAWGETAVKDNYTSLNYTGSDESNICGTEYDAATVNMGKKWRMPTATEMRELIKQCKYTVETLNGVRGGRFTASNGNSIFLPAAGWKGRTESEVGSNGAYWVGTGSGIFGLLFASSIIELYSRYDQEVGMSIRAVTEQ